jgi:hypothetical protein
VNGRLTIRRAVYWNRSVGSVIPLDGLLGIERDRYSAGVREMCCRLSLNEAFVPGAANLARTAQLTLSHNALRALVHREGRRAKALLGHGPMGPGWTAADCVDQTIITGADGVMVPLVTDQQKRKRRATEAKKRRAQGRKSTRRRGRPKTGSDGPYKEFKLVTFYDADKRHQWAMGTRGDHEALGRLMRRGAGKVRLDQATRKYSVTDGAEWIRKQYAQQLPMLDAMILDYYHLRSHVTEAAYVLHGEGTPEAVAWREEMMGLVWESGAMAMLDRLGELYKPLRGKRKRAAISSLRGYVGKRVEMLDYPRFREAGYDTGSGPTESFCGSLTSRLKGSGMHWDVANAEAMMGLGSVYHSNLWKAYWRHQRKAS